MLLPTGSHVHIECMVYTVLSLHHELHMQSNHGSMLRWYIY